ncbi:MAG: hypothetical protein E6J75_03810 [Deltaproteobacteria bacterium]|nr:MAG: hypothetical protein E6J75_03810 [Deltaproteobacteria bacterium]
MEREIIFTGIGGQGIQLMAKVLAQAAADEGKHTMLFGLYGGAMRGGPSDSTVVIGDGPIEVPPIVPACWSIVAMHPSSLPARLPSLRSAGLLFANETLVQVTPPPRATAVPVPATRMAWSASSPPCAPRCRRIARAWPTPTPRSSSVARTGRARRATRRRREPLDARDGHHRPGALQGVRALRSRLPAQGAGDVRDGEPQGLPLSASARRLHEL